MSAYNTLSLELACPRCHALSPVIVQYKYAATRQHTYKPGDALAWGGNDIGRPEFKHVVVDGVVEARCPACAK